MTASNRLSTEHRAHLLKELGPEGPDLAANFGACSIDAGEAHRLGFRWGSHRTGGLLLPFDGDFAQLRCDDPPIDQSGRAVKYLNRAGAKQQPATFGDGSPTVATEGWKDGLAIHLRTGATVQAIPGVTAHKALAETVIQLIYDADARENPAVWSQLVTAGLQRRILSVGFFPAEIAGPKGGACEFFAQDGDFRSIAWRKPRLLLQELPKGWKPDIRADWKPHAVRHLARLAIRAGYGRDTARQMVADAAKAIKLPVQQARQVFAAEQRKAAPPPKTTPTTGPAHVQLIAAMGSGPPPEIVPKVYAGFWAQQLRQNVGKRLRRNLLTQQTELDGAEISVESEELLYVWAQQADWRITKPDCYDGTRAAALENAYHPVCEYLDGITADPTIEPIDLDTIAERYLSVKDKLSARMLRCALIGAVARVHQPGCEPPGVVVLRGHQGIRKSGFWKALGGPFYVVSREHDKASDQSLAMHRSWIYDLDELNKVTTTRQAASLRSQITTSTDTFRVPYAKREQCFPRQFIIVAAVNGDGFLTDPEGNRRYWVIDCPQKKDSGEFIDAIGADRDRDAIWKSAVQAYRSGEAWTLTPEEQAASNARNGKWEAVDEWQAALLYWAQEVAGVSLFTTREAIEGAGLRDAKSISKPDEMRAAECLKRAGVQRTEDKVTRPAVSPAIGGRRDRFWIRPGAQPAQPCPASDGEVGQPETHCGERLSAASAQPAQPKTQKTGEAEEQGASGDGTSSIKGVLAVSDGQVGHTTPNRLRRNGSGVPNLAAQPLEVGQTDQAPFPPLPGDVRLERTDASAWVGLARDVLGDAGQAYDAAACRGCLQAWHDAHPDLVPEGISRAQVERALGRLTPFRPVDAQQALPGVA